MLRLPDPARILQQFAVAFTAPSFKRFLLLAVGAILTLGRHTVSRILWVMRPFLDGHFSDYHRLFSRARWSLWPLGRLLAAAVLDLVPADQVVVVDLDDTVDGPHEGDHVYGKGCWRDAVRSSCKHLALTWGHKWVVLAVNVQFPFCRRCWALPILVALARKQELDQQEQRRHKTPAHLAVGLLAALVHWFPQRRFLALGDWGFGSHELAEFASRHRDRLTVIARCRADTNLYTRPRHPRRTKGGWQQKGHKLPSPRQTAQKSPGYVRVLPWYGNRRRELTLVSGCGLWYSKHRNAVVPIRWVRTYDRIAEREDYLYSTDLALTPEAIVEWYTGRFSIEVTFQEVRAHLGLGSTRSWAKQPILRLGPCLFGLFSVVCVIYARMVQSADGRWPRRVPVRQMPCYRKAEPTFSDAVRAVRKLLWSAVPMEHRAWRADVARLSPAFKNTLLDYLAEAG